MVKVLKSPFGKLLHYSNRIVEIKYGALYNWYAASKNGGAGVGSIAPNGWHVPSNAEFSTLISYVGGSSTTVALRLKSSNSLYWAPGNQGNNISGFNLYGSSWRSAVSNWATLKTEARLWTYELGYYAWQGKSLAIAGNISQGTADRRTGYSIRCIKDSDSWTEGETVTDIDGNIYPTTKIGDQVWMAANLIVTHYNDGNPIPNVTSNEEWRALTTGAMCYYDNDINNAYIVTGSNNKILRTALPVPQGLELTFDDIDNVPVADASSVLDWNTFFDLPTNGGEFASVDVIGNIVKLFGGIEITLKSGLFSESYYSTHLLSLNDKCGSVKYIESEVFSETLCTEISLPEVVSIGYANFRSSTNLSSVGLLKLESAGDANFSDCPLINNYNFPLLLGIGDSFFQNATAVSYNMPMLLSCGSSVSNNGIFTYITGRTITLTIPSALMTCNAGAPDGDIQYLIDNNTVTIFDPLGNQIYP